MRVLSLLAALALAVFGLAEAPAYVAVYVESPVEIPPLAYFNGTHYKPVHVYYVAKWEKAVWFGEVVDIPVWDFKRAIIYIPNEAFKAKTPPRPLGVLEVAIEGKKALLVEAPDDVLTAYGYLKEAPAEAKRANATWIRQPTKRGLGDKPIPQPRDAKKEPEPLGPESSGSEPLYISSTSSVVFPSGAFYFNKTTRYMVAYVTYCLPVRTVNSGYVLPRHQPTFAALGYNASSISRTAWYVYTPSAPIGEVVGRAWIRVYETRPNLSNAVPLDTQWFVELRNGYVTFTTSISLPSSWSTKHLALELCFQPYRSGTFTVGANATVSFAKRVFAYAIGDYYLGVRHPTSALVLSFNTPFRNVLIGPFALADGYYSAGVEWYFEFEVPWPNSNCPTLTARLYMGQRAEMQIDTATGTLLRYEWGTGKCVYEVRRYVPLHSGAMGVWYNEARARESGVFFRVELSHGADRVRVYRIEMKGGRYVENFIDKLTYEWSDATLLRGFLSTIPVYNPDVTPQVTNRTSPTYVLVEVRHRLRETYNELVNVYITSNSSQARIGAIVIHVSPRDAYGGHTVFTAGSGYQEPWFISMFFEAVSIVRSILDFLGRLPGPVSFFIDMIFDVRSGMFGDSRVEYTSTGVKITWRSGYAESYRYVGIGLKTPQTITRTIEVQQVVTNTPPLGVNYPNFAITIPGVNVEELGGYSNARQEFYHWAYATRHRVGTPLVVS